MNDLETVTVFDDGKLLHLKEDLRDNVMRCGLPHRAIVKQRKQSKGWAGRWCSLCLRDATTGGYWHDTVGDN